MVILGKEKVPLVGIDLSAKSNGEEFRICDKNESFSRVFLHKVHLLKVCLDESNFEFANLSSSYFGYSDLLKVNFSCTDLENSTFETSCLRGVNFTASNLACAKFIDGCQLQHSKFNKADLDKCSFVRAHLIEADFTEAILDGTDFSRVGTFIDNILRITITFLICRLLHWDINLEIQLKMIIKIL